MRAWPWRFALAAALVLFSSVQASAQESQPETLAELIRGHPELSTFTEYLETGSIMVSLERPVRLTVLAPSNAAWERLSEAEREGLLRNPGALNHVVRHHISMGTAPLSSLRRLDALTSLNQTRISTTQRGDRLLLEGARVVEADLRAGNGIVHVIDQVLIPGSATSIKSLLAGPQGR